jgi:hypothetical protein
MGLKLELNVEGNVAPLPKHVIEAFEFKSEGVCSVLSLLPSEFLVKGETLDKFVLRFHTLNPLGREWGGRAMAALRRSKATRSSSS